MVISADASIIVSGVFFFFGVCLDKVGFSFGHPFGYINFFYSSIYFDSQSVMDWNEFLNWINVLHNGLEFSNLVFLSAAVNESRCIFALMPSPSPFTFMLLFCNCSILTSDPAKHAIPKTAEVAYSTGVGELSWQYGTGLKFHVQSQTDAPEEGDMWTVWQLFPFDDDQYMPSHRRRKLHIPLDIYGKRWSGRQIQSELENDAIEKTAPGRMGTRDPNWGFWRSESWKNDAEKKTAPSRELGPRASGWATLENVKDTRLCPEELEGQYVAVFVHFPTPSHTQPFQIKWEVYFSKELCRSSLLLLCRYASAYEYAT